MEKITIDNDFKLVYNKENILNLFLLPREFEKIHYIDQVYLIDVTLIIIKN